MPDFTSSPYYPAAIAAANTYGIPANLFVAQIGQESQFNPYAVNGTAVGIAQFKPGTAADLGINPLDPTAALYGAAKYDAQLYASTGSWQQTLQQYGTTAGGNGANVNAIAQQLDQSTPNTLSQVLGTIGAPLGITPQGVQTVQDVGSAASGILSFLATPSRWASLLIGLIFVAGGLYLFGNQSVQSAISKIKGAANVA